jgi:hypothetical protein
MPATQTLDQQLQHFARVNSHNILAAGEALANGSIDVFKKLSDRVASMEITASIANLVNSSRDSFKGFVARFEGLFPADARKFIFGTVLSGVGGVMLAEAAGLAAILGISTLSVGVIAIGLLLWGLSMSFPAIWGLAMKKLGVSAKVESLSE